MLLRVLPRTWPTRYAAKFVAASRARASTEDVCCLLALKRKQALAISVLMLLEGEKENRFSSSLAAFLACHVLTVTSYLQKVCSPKHWEFEFLLGLRNVARGVNSVWFFIFFPTQNRDSCAIVLRHTPPPPPPSSLNPPLVPCVFFYSKMGM